jgi:hypothetical protein
MAQTPAFLIFSVAHIIGMRAPVALVKKPMKVKTVIVHVLPSVKLAMAAAIRIGLVHQAIGITVIAFLAAQMKRPSTTMKMRHLTMVLAS